MAAAKKKTVKKVAPKLTDIQRKKIAREFLVDLFDKRKSERDFALFPSSSASSGAYRGTRTGKHNEQWEVYDETADQELRYEQLETLRFRSRQLTKDNPIAEGTVICFEEMVVGDGPFPLAKIPKNNGLQFAAQQVLEKWGRACDVTGDMSFNQIMRDIVAHCCINGDVLITLPMMETRQGIKTVVQLIEADRISTPSGFDSKPVRHGVQYSAAGEIDGYWVRKIGMSNDDHQYGSFSNPGPSSYTFYPRMKAGRLSAWLFKRPSAINRAGQSRQIPLLSTAIHILKQMEDLLDATVVGERVAACMMAAITSSDVEGIVDAMTRDPYDGDRLEDKYGMKYSKMQPGTFLPLRSGEDVKMLSPTRNGQEVVNTLMKLSVDLSMKVRIPYPILFMDLKGTSFSSYRAGILEARKMLAGWRKQLTEKVVDPILGTIMQEALVRDLLFVPSEQQMARLIAPKVGWPAWGYVDPTKEVQAELSAISGGLTSPQRVVREHGMDSFEILEEHALYEVEKKRLEDEYGVKISVSYGKGGAAAPAPAPDSGQDEDDEMDEETPEDEQDEQDSQDEQDEEDDDNE